MNKTIILYWMRWTWKTSIGRLLSQKLNKNFIDLDEFIENKIWDKINTFVSKNGWDAFRDKEHECLKEVLENYDNVVLSLGWWAITFERNSRIILKNAYKLIYIYSSLKDIVWRITNDENSGNSRPNLTWKSVLEELSEIYEKRKEIYEKFYDLKVENNWSLENIVSKIISKINYWNICVPITNFSNIEKQIEIINNDNRIKYVELRIDFLDDAEKLKEIVWKIDKQIILTLRTKSEWWNFSWSEKEYFEILQKYWKLWDFVDVELSKLENTTISQNSFPSKNKKVKTIISYHNFEKTPKFEELVKILEKMKTHSPDVYKIAVMPKNENDIEMIYKLSEYFKQNFSWEFIFISMWEIGKQTRIKIPQMWWLLTFWSLSDISAPGQIWFEELYEKIFNF